MKRFILLLVLAFSIFNSQFSISFAQGWKELMDSTKFYHEKRDFGTAIKFAKQSLELAKKQFGEQDTNSLNLMSTLAELFYYSGQMDSALNNQEKLLFICRQNYSGDHTRLASCINIMAYLYYKRGNYKEAEPLFKEALGMRRRLFKGDHPDLASSISTMAFFYGDWGNYKEAEPLFKEALEMNKRLFKGDHPDLASSINNMAVFYKISGNYKEAEPLYKEALEMHRRLFKGDHTYLATNINNVALFYKDRGNYKEAEPLYKEALEMSRRLFKGDHPALATSINNMAMFYSSSGNYKEAEPLFKEALGMRRRLFKGDHPDLATSINNLAYFYKVIGNYKEAELLFVEALEMSRRLFKGDHPNLALNIISMASFYNGKGNYIEAEPLYFEAIKTYQNMLNNYFPSLSEKEKKQFWNTVSAKFEIYNNFSVIRADENPAILCNTFDMLLYSKALLFNSVNRIKTRILNSGDSVLKADYQRWSDIKDLLVSLYKMTNEQIKKKGFNTDSIEKAANELEKQISLKSEGFKESYEKKKVNWKSVQTLLKPDEAAVEVIRYRYHDNIRWTDTVYYAFLIVSEQTEAHPELVLIKNGNMLEKEYYDEYRDNVKLKKQDKVSFERYWGKLNEKLKSFKKIFFSADGIYNKLNPSTLQLPGGKYLLDIQDIQQLNSTKDLLLGYYQTKQESNIYNSAVLIGNPNFSLSEAQVREISKKVRGESSYSQSYEKLANLRGRELTKLPGTEKEIKDIEKFLKSTKWDVNSYLSDMAVKSAVVNAKSPRVLHIATHGLFLDDVKWGGKELFGFDEQKMIDNPLLRSGLFFTGADNYLKSEKQTTTGDENGLLTAYEAMNLNLDKTELVVLSACETGLGEIQNGEGVFGLRRAFQQAGAKTVMMSLWKVNDEATQELMSNFYKNWVTGMTKRDAFAKAQQTIRRKYPEPYYWGAFVMVGE